MFKTKNQKRLFSNRTTDVVERRAADVMRKHETALTVERENEERKAFERMVDQACEILNNLKVPKAKRRGWIWFVATMLVAGVIGFAFWGISKTDETHVVEQTSVSAPVSAPKDVSTKSVAAQKVDVPPRTSIDFPEVLVVFGIIWALSALILMLLSMMNVISADKARTIWFSIGAVLIGLAFIGIIILWLGVLFTVCFIAVLGAMLYFDRKS